jgi:hypothetical protein
METLWHIGNSLPDHTMSHPKRQQSSNLYVIADKERWFFDFVTGWFEEFPVPKHCHSGGPEPAGCHLADVLQHCFRLAPYAQQWICTYVCSNSMTLNGRAVVCPCFKFDGFWVFKPAFINLVSLDLRFLQWYEENCLLGCDTMQYNRSSVMFQRNVLPPFSEWAK